MGSIPRDWKYGASHHAVAIMLRLSSTGVAADTTKRRQVFSTPADSATSDMKPI